MRRGRKISGDIPGAGGRGFRGSGGGREGGINTEAEEPAEEVTAFFFSRLGLGEREGK